MNRTDIINYLISQHNLKSYLEIGLDNPDANYNHVICEFKESCDPYINDNWDGHYDRNALPDEVKNVLTYHMTSDEMFKINDKKYDIIFIDGYHEQMQVGRDIINALRHLNPGGVIVVHDCLPPIKEMQEMPRMSGGWNGDVWKAIPKLALQNITYNVVTTDYGVGIIPYHERWKELQDITEESSLNWENFVTNWIVLMNAITEEEFVKKYK